MGEINIIEVPDFGKKKIGVLCLAGLETFIKPIVTHLEEKYLVKTYYGNSLPEATSVIDFADLVIFEFANEMVVELSNKVPALADKKVLVRLHSYEALSGYVKQINWSVIDSLVFVAEHIKKLTIEQFPKLPEFVRTHVVANGV